jgi:hypothetical protein
MREPRKKRVSRNGDKTTDNAWALYTNPEIRDGLGRESSIQVSACRGRCGIASKTEHERVCCKPGGSSWGS